MAISNGFMTFLTTRTAEAKKRHSVAFFTQHESTEASTDYADAYDTWGLTPASRPKFKKPTLKSHYVDIPGANGDLDLTESLTGAPVYNPIDDSIVFDINEYRDSNNHTITWSQRYDEIANFLHGRSCDVVLLDDLTYVKVSGVWTIQSGWHYKGRVTVDDFVPGEVFSQLTLSFHLQPYKLNISGSNSRL